MYIFIVGERACGKSRMATACKSILKFFDVQAVFSTNAVGPEGRYNPAAAFNSLKSTSFHNLEQEWQD